VAHSSPFTNEQVSSPEFDAPFGSYQFPPSNITTTPHEAIVATSLGEVSQAKVQPSTTGAAQQIHRLDAMMFPSDDPLAYPNQPRVDFGMHGAGLHATNPGDMLQHDPSAFFVPQSYDGIEGHLLGPLPQYLMHPQGDPGIHFPAQMYLDPMLPSQHIHAQQSRVHAHRFQAEQEQLRQQSREYNDVIANTSWQSMFPQHGME
jgi:hypothetical protein